MKFKNVHGTGQLCSAPVGKNQTLGEHPVELEFETIAGGKTCGNNNPIGSVTPHGMVIHELMHVIGMFSSIRPML